MPLHAMVWEYCDSYRLNTSSMGAGFKECCRVDWFGGLSCRTGEDHNLAMKTKGSYQACVGACAQANMKSPKARSCKAIAYAADLTFCTPTNDGSWWREASKEEFFSHWETIC